MIAQDSGLRTQDSGLRTQALRCALVLLTLAALDGAITAQTPTPASSTHVLFEPNVGQWPSSVLFEARTRAGRIHGLRDGLLMTRRTSKKGWVSATLRFLDAAGVSTVQPGEKDICRVNRYIGNDASKWFEGIPTYRTMTLHDLYDGVDLALRSEDGLLAFDLHVAPGVPTDRIRFQIVEEGFTTRIEGGQLVVRRDGEVFMRLLPPKSFQQGTAQSFPVASRFAERTPGVFGFDVPFRDPALPLVIDPQIALFSTYSGGAGPNGDTGHSVDIDDLGFVYAGSVDNSGSQAFVSNPTIGSLGPVNSPDMLFVKYALAGAAQWATYVGGALGDHVEGVAVRRGVGLFACGYTFSTNFPTMNSVLGPPPAGTTSQLALLKIDDATGAVRSSSLFGGSGNDGANRIALSTTGQEVALVGSTTSTDLIPSGVPSLLSPGGGMDAFVINVVFPNGVATWNYGSYFGGPSLDQANDVVMDAQGRVYVVGLTSSLALPSTTSSAGFTNLVPGGTALNGGQDAFLAGFSFSDTGLVLEFSSYFGGSASVGAGTFPNDSGNGIALTSAGQILIAGETMSTNLPTTSGVVQPSFGSTTSMQPDAFVASMTWKPSAGGAPSVMELNWSTYLGGTTKDSASAVGVDPVGNVIVGGSTDSPNFPVSSGNALQPSLGGFRDAFVTKLDARGSGLLWSTYWGGANDEESLDLAVRADGNVVTFVGTVLVSGAPLSFPTAGSPVEQGLFGGGSSDAFVASFGEPDISVSPLTVKVATPVGTSTSFQVTVSNVGVATLNYTPIPLGPVSPGSPFSVTQVNPPPQTGFLAPGATLNVIMSFSPTVAGTVKDVLLISSDDADEATVAVTLIGN